jgi:hypothetical protein
VTEQEQQDRVDALNRASEAIMRETNKLDATMIFAISHSIRTLIDHCGISGLAAFGVVAGCAAAAAVAEGVTPMEAGAFVTQLTKHGESALADYTKSDKPVWTPSPR